MAETDPIEPTPRAQPTTAPTPPPTVTVGVATTAPEAPAFGIVLVGLAAAIAGALTLSRASGRRT